MSLMKLNNALRKHSLLADQRGLSTVEYVIILVVVAVAAVGVWTTFGKTIQQKITGSTDTIEHLGAESK